MSGQEWTAGVDPTVLLRVGSVLPAPLLAIAAIWLARTRVKICQQPPAGKSRRFCSIAHSAPSAVLLCLTTSGVALWVYLRTLHPGVYWGDTAELQYAALTLAPPHPTGYPLYLLLGHGWLSLMPLGTVAWRLNLFSALCSALTVGTTAAVALRITSRPWVSALVALVLAFAPSFWSQAVIAEVYSLHTLLVALLLLSLTYRDSAPIKCLLAVAFLFGLGLAHHRMMVLLLPGVVLYLLPPIRNGSIVLSRRVWVMAGFVLLLPLALYWVTYANLASGSWSDFITITLHGGRQWFGFDDPIAYFVRVVAPQLLQQLGLAGLALAALGVVAPLRDRTHREADITPVVGISWLVAVAFLAYYRVVDMHAFATHVQVLTAVLIAAGLHVVLSWLEARLSVRRVRALSAALAAALVLALLLQARGAWRANDRSRDYVALERSLAVLNDIPQGGVIYAGWLMGHVLRYHQDVDGLRTDVAVFWGPSIDPNGAAEFLASGRPVYLWGPARVSAVDRSTYEVLPIRPRVHREPLYDEPSTRLFHHRYIEAIRKDFGLASLDLRDNPGLAP